MVGCGIRDTRGRGTGGLGVLVEGILGLSCIADGVVLYHTESGTCSNQTWISATMTYTS